MKHANDDRTIDMLGLARPRGRPAGIRPAMTGAQRQAAKRARLIEQGKGVLTVEVSLDVVTALDAFVKFKDVTKGDVVDRILRGTLLRKR